MAKRNLNNPNQYNPTWPGGGNPYNTTNAVGSPDESGTGGGYHPGDPPPYLPPPGNGSGGGTPSNTPPSSTNTPPNNIRVPGHTLGGALPAYVNWDDPVHQAVWRAFEAKGKTPRDQQDFEYWVNRINSTGGGWNNEENRQWWLNRMGQAQGGVGDYGGGSEDFGIGTSPQANPQMDQLMNLLMARANQSLGIDPKTDPFIRPQVDNYAAAQERSRRNYLDNLAESNSPYSTGAGQYASTQTAEAAGQNTANLQSTLMTNELTARRTEIQNALSEMGALLTSQQQLALQRELGMIDAALRRFQLQSNNEQFLATLGFNTADRAAYWDWIHSGGGNS